MDSFFGIGIFELFLIAVIALVVLGPERLPGAMREVAKYMRQIRDIGSEFSSQFSEEIKMLEEMDPRRMINDVLDPSKTPSKPQPAKPTTTNNAAKSAAAAAAVAKNSAAPKENNQNTILPPQSAQPEKTAEQPASEQVTPLPSDNTTANHTPEPSDVEPSPTPAEDNSSAQAEATR